MAYKALEVAQYIINRSIETGSPVTNLKLQKVLYYTQAAFLVEYGEPCFEESIEHWRHGPVVPKVYSEYKGYVDKKILDAQDECLEVFVDSNGNLAAKRLEFNRNNFYEEDIELMNTVIDSYQNVEPWEMVDKTHEELPWRNTEPNGIITKSSIMQYFEQHNDRIYGGK